MIENVSMLLRNQISHALKIANHEADAGNIVMVLFPNRGWVSAALRRPLRDNVHLRATTVESSLKTLAIDTLILVGRTDASWNENGEKCAREKLRTSKNPRVIMVKVDED